MGGRISVGGEFCLQFGQDLAGDLTQGIAAGAVGAEVESDASLCQPSQQWFEDQPGASLSRQQVRIRQFGGGGQWCGYREC
ncbi:MAG TPA: hypothetical protein DCR20_11200 [Planctomycetaceae bacterium]|nr:hypothetical protein [Planctomycetaceae bacterium]